MFRCLRIAALSAAISGLSAAAQAAPVTPTFTDFGLLPGATFGGSGIPNDRVAISTFSTSDGSSLTLGLAATERYSNQPVTDDGAGTYTALTGANNGTPGDGGTAAVWNFSFFAELTPGRFGTTDTLASLGVQLLYDLDPGQGTDRSDLGVINLGLASGGSLLVEDSQNATFAFLASGIPGFVTPPTFSSFDPNVTGEYSFVLASNLGDVAINVGVVPLPAGALLLISALGGFGLVRRRKTV